MSEPEDIKDIIAENLLRFRTQANLTQAQLAELLNYSDKAVSKWERESLFPISACLCRLQAYTT